MKFKRTDTAPTSVKENYIDASRLLGIEWKYRKVINIHTSDFIVNLKLNSVKYKLLTPLKVKGGDLLKHFKKIKNGFIVYLGDPNDYDIAGHIATIKNGVYYDSADYRDHREVVLLIEVIK